MNEKVKEIVEEGCPECGGELRKLPEEKTFSPTWKCRECGAEWNIHTHKKSLLNLEL